MRYRYLPLLSAFILAGCGSSSSSDDEVQLDNESIDIELSDNDIVDQDELNDESNIDNNADSDFSEAEQETPANDDQASEAINYGLIGCEDYLNDVIVLINELRSESQVCGLIAYPAVNEVSWNESLYLAAQGHSDNMANYNFFSHTGEDGGSVSSRVTEQGYEWRAVAENIAAGQISAQEAVDEWMKSEGHCINIMSPNVTEMGLACTKNEDAKFTVYWTQVFANPY